MKAKTLHIHDFPLLAGAAAIGGNAQTIDLPRGFLYRTLYVLALAVLTDDGAGGAPAYSEDCQHRMAGRIRVVRDGGTPIDVPSRFFGRSIVEPMFAVQDDFFGDPPAIGGAHDLVHAMRIPLCDESPGTPKVAQVSTLIRSWARRTFRLELTTPANAAEMMAGTGGGTVALTSMQYRVFADVYEVDDSEKKIFDKACQYELRCQYEQDEWGAARAYQPFLNHDLPRGNQILAMGLTALDNGLRDQEIINTLALRIGSEPFLPEMFPWFLLKAQNVNERQYDAPDGITWLDLDKERGHGSAPWTSTLNQLRLMFDADAPGAGLGTLHYCSLERGLAEYIG